MEDNNKIPTEQPDKQQPSPDKPEPKKPNFFVMIALGVLAFMLFNMISGNAKKAAKENADYQKELAEINRVINYETLNLVKLEMQELNSKQHYILVVNKDGRTLYLTIVNTAQPSILTKIAMFNQGNKFQIAWDEVHMLSDFRGTISEKYVNIQGDDVIKPTLIPPAHMKKGDK